MQAPIPDDWINEAWLCYAIQWPDSTKWLAILNGLLSNPRQGRFWNAQTGSIINVQVTGKEIWYRNQPLVPCADSEDCPGQTVPETVYVYCAADDDESEEDMSNCNSPTPPIKITDGVLYYWFCCQWVQIGFVGSLTNSALPDEPLVPPDDPADPNPTYSACGKAKAIRDFMVLVMHAIWDARASGPLMVGEVQGEIGYDLNNTWMVYCGVKCIEFNALDGGWDSSPLGWNLYDPIEQDQILCKLSALFADDAAGVPEDELFEAIKWVYINEMLIDLPRRFCWSYAFNAVGKGVLDTVAKLGATNTAADCTCPDPPIQLFPNIGSGADWRYVWDLKNALPAYISLVGTSHHQLGQGVWDDCGATQNYNKPQIDIQFDQMDNGSVLTNVGIIYMTRGDEQYNAGSGLNRWCMETINHLAVADYVAATGELPAQAGTWQLSKVVNDALDADDNTVRIGVDVYHAGEQKTDVIGNSVVILAVLAAGTGPGPLSTPPE